MVIDGGGNPVALAAEGVHYGYPGGEPVLRGVDLALGAGEVVALIGPNGAGKSTLLKLLGGLLRPDAGTAQLGGSDVAGLPAKERARSVALVPQALFALPDLTVEEFVAQGRYAHRGLFRGASAEDRAAVARALDEAEVADLARRPLAELSGGQRQRALVARALSQEPRFVLVDEPTNSLDPAHQLQVFELIAGLGCVGRAALVVTHDLNLASQFATRVVLLTDGVVTADGPVREVLTPGVLRPVYGDGLRFGELFAPGWGEARPWVLPWRSPGDPRA